MRFSDLPARLKLYIVGHLCVIPLLVGALSNTGTQADWRLVSLLLLSTLVFSTWKVELTIMQGRMTPTFAVVCLALLLQGLPAALLCAAFGAWVGSFVRSQSGGWKITLLRPQGYRVWFNTANCGLACVTAASAFELVAGSLRQTALGVVLGLMVFTAFYFLINTAGVAVALALREERSWISIWKLNFLWTAPGFFASASAAAGIQAAYHYLGAWSLLLLPPLYLISYSYRLYMDRLRLFSEKMQQDMQHIKELNKLNQSIIASLATAIDAKDHYTCSHINRVQCYALMLARAAGLAEADVEAVKTGALVHDIGKLGVPDHILNKPGKLTAEEFKRIQSHVTIGAEILAPVPFPFPVVDVVLTHHERWDGLGYPRGLEGEGIYIGGRIISIVDVFDALTSDRPYRRGLPREEALRILKEGAGKQFDPQLVGLFEKVLPEALQEIAAMEAQQELQAADPGVVPDGPSAWIQIRQAAAEMAAVKDVAHALAEQETVDDLMQVLLKRTLSLLPADTAICYLVPPGETHLVAAAVAGKYDEKLAGMAIQLGEGMAGWVAEKQQSRINVSASLDVARRFTPEEVVELSAATAVPLKSESGTFGVLAVYTMAYSVIAEAHLHLLSVLAEHAATAFQNVQRFEAQRELAVKDSLTGLLNSRGLNSQLTQLLGCAANPVNRREQRFSLLMLDLDHFKDINDQLGHLRGDEALRMVAEMLKKSRRSEDVICRYGGDEFVLLLPGAARAQAEQVAMRVREAFAALPAVDGRVKVGVSIGVASFPEDGGSGEVLLHAADCRMYDDKLQRRCTTSRTQVRVRNRYPVRRLNGEGTGAQHERRFCDVIQAASMVGEDLSSGSAFAVPAGVDGGGSPARGG